MTAKCVMVLGPTSGAGKSWLTTALCRYYARQGLKVVPFKAQNMSNNARVVASDNGQGEIGSAQYFQSLAARAVPDVRMNPLLLKPERALIKGYVLNKFRGDASLLAPAPQMLQDLTGVPTVATLPMWWQHGLPEEDGMFDDRSTAAGAVTLTVAVIAYPRISNLDEFQPLKNIPGVRLLWVRSPSELAGLAPTDWIILPGSKHTSSDLAWLRHQGLDAAVAHHAAQGGAVLGVCGGLQMLGEALIDTHGIDGNAPGLGLLPLVTVFEADKTVRHTQARFDTVMALPGATVYNPWAALAGVQVAGYEIHHGQTQQRADLALTGDVARVVMPGELAWQNEAGNVLGLYLHGLFEDPAALQALFGASLAGPVPTLDGVFDGLADYIAQHFEPGVLDALIA